MGQFSDRENKSQWGSLVTDNKSQWGSLVTEILISRGQFRDRHNNLNGAV